MDQMRGSCGAARGLPRPCKMWRRLCCENASKRLTARGLGHVAHWPLCSHKGRESKE